MAAAATSPISTKPSVFAFVSWICARFGILAIGTVFYSLTTGGFRFYDPTLLKLYRSGLLLGLGGLVFALVGVWNRNSLRWHAPALSLSMLLLWLIWLSSE
jgi:hypothetical protein